MKRFCYILLTLVLVSCGSQKGQFKIEGRFLNLNQGEFYVYSTDGLINGMDTIHTDGGRFSYQIPCETEGTLMLVFPNFSEQPIFAQSGKTVNVKGDATHLKEMSVEGTEANELMTRFRQSVLNATPPEATRNAALFINYNAQSPVSLFLLKRYFVQSATPDLTKASELIDVIVKAQPKNGEANRLKRNIDILKISQLNRPVPAFSAPDINGHNVSNADLSGKVGVIHVWSTWNYESQDIQRRIRAMKQEKGGRLGVVGICIDGSKRDCRNYLKHDSVAWSTICDEQMMESPLLEKLGMMSVPDNIVIDTGGRIIARGLNANEMRERLEQLLK